MGKETDPDLATEAYRDRRTYKSEIEQQVLVFSKSELESQI